MAKEVQSALAGEAPRTVSSNRETVREQAPQSVSLPQQTKRERSKVAPGLYRPIPEETLVEWDAPARPFKKKDRQFFTTTIVIAILISLILFFTGQLLPVAVVISAVFLIYVTSVIPPNEVHIKLTNYGLYFEKEAFAWQEMGRFWFDNKHGQEVVNIELYRFPGRLTLVIVDGQTPSKLDFNLVFSEVLVKEKPELTYFEKAAEWFQEKVPLE